MRKNTALALLAAAFVFGCDNPTPEPTPSKPTAASPTSTATAAATPSVTATAAPAVAAKGPFPASTNPALKDPSKAKDKAPAKFKAKFETTAGDFEVECTRDWAPNGVDRFYNLVKIGFFDDTGFFRVVKKPRPFVVQWGIHGDPDVAKVWDKANIDVDKVKSDVSNTRGMLTYAMAGSPTTRSSQLFINFGDNARLDGMGFAPICKVAGDGMDVVDKIDASAGEQPDQEMIQTQGNKYLRKSFPALDYIKTARIVDDKATPAKK